MPIPNYRITDLRSFTDVTKEPHQIAGLYFYQVLDSLVELSYRVSADFRKRPQLYRDLGQPSIAPILAELNAQYGTEVNFLSAGQRNEVYLPIFGSWGGLSSNIFDSFSRLRDDLIHAATVFAECAVGPGVAMLREGVRTAHRPFKDYLVGMQGASVRFSKEIALSNLTEKTCYPILRSQAVAAVFGIVKLAGVEYPYATDPAADSLVEEISRCLDSSRTYTTRERIANLQSAAHRGTEAIATAIDFEESDPAQTDADLDLLISKCYAWGTALASLKAQPMNWVAPTAPSKASVPVTRPNTPLPAPIRARG